MKELFEKPLVPVRTNKTAFDKDEGELDIKGGDVLINPRIIGGESRDFSTSRVTYTFYEYSVAQSANMGIPATIVVDRNCTIDKVYIQVETAPGSGKTITVDIHKNGTTIFTTQGNRPSIAGTATTDESGVPSIVNLLKNDLLTMDIDVHDGSATQLSVYVRCK